LRWQGRGRCRCRSGHECRHRRSCEGGLHFVDVTDGKKPKLIRSVNVSATQVEIVDGIAFATVGSQIYSFEPLTGEIITFLHVPMPPRLLAWHMKATFSTQWIPNRILHAFEAQDETLTLRGTVQMTNGGSKISVANGVVYAAAGPSLLQGGFATADVSNPSNLVEISPSTPGAFGFPGDVIIANGSGLGLLGGALAFGGSKRSISSMSGTLP